EKGGAAAAEGAMICVMENNIEADNGAKRTPATPKFRHAGDITGRNFDARRYVTEVATSGPVGAEIVKGKTRTLEDLSGSVVRIGGQWSVVKSSSPTGLTIWGKISDEAA